MFNRKPVKLLGALLALVIVLGGCTLAANRVQLLLSRTSQAETNASNVSAVTPTSEALPTLTATTTPAATDAPAPAAQQELVTQNALSDEQLYDIAEALTIQVYERVSPSVVHVTSRVIAMDFFGRAYPSEGTGSGFVIDKQGHVVTNYHVVERAQTVEVTLLDQTVVEAEVVGVDPLNDLAVLRVEVEEDKLHPVDMGFEGDLKVGQRAIAIGNPYGLDWTLTAGVISSLGRSLQLSSERVIYDVVQTDAAINPGNSGGPLLNSRGQLIGVNVAVRSGAENIAFAIPMSTVRRVVPELISEGRYRHPWLGALGYTLNTELAERLDLPVSEGVLIARIYQGSPAARGGLRGATQEVIVGNKRLYAGGDILVSIDGVPIPGNDILFQFLETRTRVGQEVELQYYRDGELRTTRVVLTESPS